MQKKEITKITDYPIYYVGIVPVMGAKGISKNSFYRMTGIAYNVLQRYCKSEVERVGLDVISRICKVLGCDTSEITIKNED